MVVDIGLQRFINSKRDACNVNKRYLLCSNALKYMSANKKIDNFVYIKSYFAKES